MRKPGLVLTTLLASVSVLATASPASAAAPPRFSYSTTGISADAFFSDAPADGNLLPRTIYHDTFITAGQSATKSDGTTSQGSFVYYDQYSYSIDRRGNFVFEGQRFGYAEGVSFTADKKLNEASVSATVQIVDCDANFDCVEGRTQQVDIGWNGYGETTRVRGTFSVHNGTLHYTEHQNGYFRAANATGFGASLYASLFNGRTSGRCMGEGCFF